MKKLHTTVAAALLAVAIAACSDSNPVNPGVLDTYMPTAKNNTWTYGGLTDYTITVTGDTVIGGKTYTVAISSAAPASLLHYENGTYYSANTSLSVEQIYLKDNVSLGSTWTFDVPSPNGTPNHYTLSLAETGLTKTVNNKSYSDVAHVHMIDSASYLGQAFLVQAADYYYAKNIGLIESDLPQGQIYLKSYTLN